MKNKILLAGILFVSVTSMAKECPDTMTIDQLPLNKTYITFNEKTKNKQPRIKHESYAAGKEVSYKKRMIDKGFMRGLILNWIKHPGRFVELTYTDFNNLSEEYATGTRYVLTDKQVELQPAKKMRLDKLNVIEVDLTKRVYIFQSEFEFTKIESGSPVKMKLVPNRSVLDTRQQKYITLGSLKYNLGSDFTVQAYCD